MDCWATVLGQRAMDSICRIADALDEANRLKKEELMLLKKIHNIEENNNDPDS